jgi:hypothetical protein
MTISRFDAGRDFGMTKYWAFRSPDPSSSAEQADGIERRGRSRPRARRGCPPARLRAEQLVKAGARSAVMVQY